MTRHQSARAVALACAGLLAGACWFATQSAAANDAITTPPETTGKANEKANGKKSAASKSAENKSAGKKAGKKAAKSTSKSGAKSASKSKDKKSAAGKTGPASAGEKHAHSGAPGGAKSTEAAAPELADEVTETLTPSTPPPRQASQPQTSEADVALVRKAIEGLRSGGTERATQVEASISDPAARKLVEWIILRNAHSTATSARYTAFIAANPDWPSLALFHRRAEEMLWVEHPSPAQVLAFFNDTPPQTGRGRLALARAMLARGETEAAKAQVCEAWRSDPFSANVENQVLKNYAEFLSRADHKARMERLLATDKEPALRAAHRLGGADLAIARARLALNAKGAPRAAAMAPSCSNPSRRKRIAIPAISSRACTFCVTRRRSPKRRRRCCPLHAKPPKLTIPRNGGWSAALLARKLLDNGDARSAYLVMRDAADPIKENSRVERHFMAGWIALRFLKDPATAVAHFSRIQDVSIHPTSLARSHYWLGRAAEAAHRPGEARAEYEAAARSSAAYYGQIARARLGLAALALAPPPATPDQSAGAERLELVRALEVLYALNERGLVITFMADVGNKLDDVGVLAALGELAEQHKDARGMLHLGKAALGRGLPLDYYAFPTVSVPRYSPIGPAIDTALVFAIIRQESAFDPADMSAAHAMGLMQVTPVAARDTCKRFGCKYDANRLKNDYPTIFNSAPPSSAA